MRARLSTLALLLAACGQAVPVSAPPAAPREEPPPYARVHVSAPLLFGLRSTGVLSRAQRLAHLGPRRFVFGGWRVELADGGRASVSEDAFLSTISDARRCGDGWVFVTWRGTIGYAESFTGPVQRIGTVAWIDSDPRHELRTHDGVVIYTDGRGGALTGPCEGPLRPVDAVPGDVVGDVWGAGTRRLAIVGGRQLYRSEDEGRTWRRVAIADGLPRSIARDGSVSIAENRWVRVDAEGRAHPTETPSAHDWSWAVAPEPAAPALADAEQRASAALLRQRAAARNALRLRTADGSVVAFDGEHFRLVDPSSGAIRSLELAGDADCRGALAWLGARPLVLCLDRVLILDEGQLREVATPPGASRRYARAADDGAQLVFRGTCAGAPEEHALCLVHVDTGAARDLAMPPRAELVALHGDHALVRRALDDGFEIVRRDVATGAREVLHSEPDALRPLVRGRIDASGALVATLLTPGEATALRLLVHDGQAPRRPALPEGASHVGFMDPRFGVAAGETTDQLWVTEDGAQSWRPVAAPFDVPTSLRLFPDRELPAQLSCDALGCSAGAVWVERGPPARQPPRWIVPGERTEEGPAPLGPESLQLACRVEDAAEPAPDDASPGRDDPDALFEPPAASGDVRIQTTRAGAVIQWSGDDREGSFTSRARPWRIPATARDLRCTALASQRQRALLRCCWSVQEEPDYVMESCRGVGVTPDAEPTDLGADVDPEDVRSAEGRILILDTASSTVSAIDDAVRPLRRWRWPSQVRTGDEERDMILDLVTLDGAPALLRQLRRSGGHTAFLERLDEDAPPTAVALPGRGAIEACAADEGSGPVLRVPRARVRWRERDRALFHDGVDVLLRLDGERTCVRGIENELAGVSLRAQGGRLRGAIDGRPATLTCVAGRASDDTLDGLYETTEEPDSLDEL